MKKHLEQRRYLSHFQTRDLPHIFTEVLVVGSGAAGLRAAIEAASFAKVLIVTKDKLREGSTEYAQGGVAAVFAQQDSFDEHVRDTLETGQGLSDPDVVRAIVSDGPDRIRELIAWGAQFDSEDGGLALAREGGHSQARIVHAKGDATGAEIEATLAARIQGIRNIRVMANAFAVDLITDEGVCYGAVVHTRESGNMLVWARATILATGGCGRLFRETTNPDVVTGDGFGLAYRAGAALRDMEFVQFHPTTLYIAGASRALISEAVRGEGAILRNSSGERFMPNYDPDAELAPRDVVSRAIVCEMKRTGATNVFLDVTHMPPGHFAQRFPNIHRICSEFDIDVTTDFIPVRPSAHYMIGGVKVDLDGHSSIERLFAAGEVASSGLHGANRLGSNSLLEALVLGRRAGRAAGELAASRAENLVPRTINSQIEAAEPRALIVADVENALRALMWRHVSIERNADGLAAAENAVDTWCSYVMDREFEAPAGWRLQDMLTLAKIIIVCARQRTETRGVHFREDFPQPSEAWLRHSIIQRG